MSEPVAILPRHDHPVHRHAQGGAGDAHDHHSHDHHGHGHAGHSHSHHIHDLSPARPATLRFSLLTLSLAQRLSGALGLSALLWLAVWWALQ